MNYRNIITDFLVTEEIFRENRKNLIVLLGSFADFDSFEYSQQLSAQSNKLSNQSVNLILIGIGDEKSKESFCKFNKIDICLLYTSPSPRDRTRSRMPSSA